MRQTQVIAATKRSDVKFPIAAPTLSLPASQAFAAISDAELRQAIITAAPSERLILAALRWR